MPRIATRLLYVADLRARGRELFAVGCQYDLDDVVGKWRYGRYEADGVSTSWVKIKNPEYSQMVGCSSYSRRAAIAAKTSRGGLRRCDSGQATNGLTRSRVRQSPRPMKRVDLAIDRRRFGR